MAGSPPELQKNAIGMWQIVFFVIAAAAPLTGMLGIIPVDIQLGNGAGVPGAFVIAGVILLIFSVGYAAMSRHVVNAGAFYAYLAQGLSPHFGVGGAFVAVVSYTTMQVGVYALFGFFSTVILNPLLNLHLPWYAYSAVAIALVQFLGMRKLDLSGWVLGLFISLEMGILLALTLSIVWHGGGPQGFNLRPFAPREVLGGHPGIAIMFALASFVGFEATAIYGEESRNPTRTVPLATYAAVSIIMVFFAFTTWAIISSYGVDRVVAAAVADPGNFWFAKSDEYLGRIGTGIMRALLLSSIFACLLAFHNTITRYLYALGREGLLWRFLAGIHPRFKSPYKASYVQTGCAVVCVLGSVMTGADPLTVVFSWTSAFATIGIVGLQFLVSAAVMVFFRRNGMDQRVWNTIVAPVMGMVGLGYALYLLIANLPALSGSNDGLVRSFPWIMLAVMLVGIGVSLGMSWRGSRMSRRLTEALEEG
jgi:amino acid transporter